MLKKIVYISGSGRSGSTLLDVVLGTQNNVFSIGELNHMFNPGLLSKEYCSCGVIVKDCTFWKMVIDTWMSKTPVKFEEYNKQEKYFGSKKNFNELRLLLKNPTKEFLDYLEKTKLLYESISEVSKCDVLVDSSKSSNKALIVKSIFGREEVTIVHLIRKFSSVMNSYKKYLEKDLKLGIEKTTSKKGSKYIFYILPVWLFENGVLWWCLGRERKVLVYEDYINKPVETAKLILERKVDGTDVFHAEHMVAGGRVRMQSEVRIKSITRKETLPNLNFIDKLVSKVVDLTFYSIFKH